MALPVKISERARTSYIALSSVWRGFSTTCQSRTSSQYRPSDFTGQPYTGSYEPGTPTSGPLGDASSYGVPRLTPRALKNHLDQFVVGQERAKRILSVAVYNHYQRIQEIQRRDEEEEQWVQQQVRREMGQRHPVEDEFPGQQHTINLGGAHIPPDDSTSAAGSESVFDIPPLEIEKSNVLMLGPSGVGKTLMAKTLARVLEVPFSMSDCTPFTQAGYIGEDAEVCVHRLLAASNYDVVRAERGIICLDEVDKIATAKVSHGKDVSGEGVQQALLKIIEGTTLQISAKQERGSPGRPGSGKSGSASGPGGLPTGGPYTSGMSPSALGGSSGGPASGSGGGGGKNEVYNVRTDNMLFIFTGAFIGLHKMIMDRIARGSIGFGQPVRATSSSTSETSSPTSMAKEDEELFKKHLPFFTSNPRDGSSEEHNTLDLVEPSDLQKYGLIPELVGRIPVTTALSALDEEGLVRVLTEPRNSLMRQYEQLFQLSGVELRCTSAALRAIARSAMGMETGARGLRTVLERLLNDSMFDAPGSSIKYILVTEAVAQKKQAPIYLARGQQHKFHAMIAAEEEEFELQRQAVRKSKNSASSSPEHELGHDSVQNFEEYRKRATTAGSS